MLCLKCTQDCHNLRGARSRAADGLVISLIIISVNAILNLHDSSLTPYLAELHC